MAKSWTRSTWSWPCKCQRCYSEFSWTVLNNTQVSIQSLGQGANDALEPGLIGYPRYTPLADGNVHMARITYFDSLQVQYFDKLVASDSLWDVWQCCISFPLDDLVVYWHRIPYLKDNGEEKRVGTLVVFIDDGIASDTPLLALPINLSLLLKLPQDTAFVGFTSSTGLLIFDACGWWSWHLSMDRSILWETWHSVMGMVQSTTLRPTDVGRLWLSPTFQIFHSATTVLHAWSRLRWFRRPWRDFPDQKHGEHYFSLSQSCLMGLFCVQESRHHSLARTCAAFCHRTDGGRFIGSTNPATNFVLINRFIIISLFMKALPHRSIVLFFMVHCENASSWKIRLWGLNIPWGSPRSLLLPLLEAEWWNIWRLEPCLTRASQDNQANPITNLPQQESSPINSGGCCWLPPNCASLTPRHLKVQLFSEKRSWHDGILSVSNLFQHRIFLQLFTLSNFSRLNLLLWTHLLIIWSRIFIPFSYLHCRSVLAKANWRLPTFWFHSVAEEPPLSVHSTCPPLICLKWCRTDLGIWFPWFIDDDFRRGPHENSRFIFMSHK